MVEYTMFVGIAVVVFRIKKQLVRRNTTNFQEPIRAKNYLLKSEYSSCLSSKHRKDTAYSRVVFLL